MKKISLKLIKFLCVICSAIFFISCEPEISEPAPYIGNTTVFGQPIPNVWGISQNNKVWKWDGNSWFEPNPAARLDEVSVGRFGDVMGLTSDGKVWKWDGNSWFEPNPNARLSQISTINGSDAWGVGSEGRVFNTINGGVSWGEVFFTKKIKQISTGNWNNIWALTEDNHILKFDGISWTEPNIAARAFQISAFAVPTGAWAIGDDNRIFITFFGDTWIEPNPSGRLSQISGVSDLHAWGIGYGARVFQTKNRGTGWAEPNAAARLKQISGY